MEHPKNCRECKNPCNYPTYYGGSMCKHKEEIYRAQMVMFNDRSKTEQR